MRTLLIAATTALALSTAACNVLLGIGPLPNPVADAGPSTADDASDDGATSNDASPLFDGAGDDGATSSDGAPGGATDGAMDGATDGAKDASTGSDDAGSHDAGADAPSIDAADAADAAVCAPGTLRCNGGSATETCNDASQWDDASACPLATPFCNGEGVCGLCTIGAHECADGGVSTCGDGAIWTAPTACVGQACLSGACSGECTPGTSQCDLLQPQTCDSTGTWQNDGGACPFVCTNGQCVGSCTPGSKSCSNNGVETCLDGGTWSSPATCTNSACVDGGCTGSCTPGAVECNADASGTLDCNGAGAWQAQTTCTTSYANMQAGCVDAGCVDTCVPGYTLCAADTCYDLNTDSSHCGSCTPASSCNAQLTGSSCVGGTCGCTGGLSACNGACVNYTDDAKNCGTCGHSCGGGSCSSSVCQPWAIAAAQVGDPIGIAMDTSSIFWTEESGNYVYQIAKGGGSVIALGPGGAGDAWGVTTDGTSVYWTNRSTATLWGNTVGGGTAYLVATSPSGAAAGSYGVATNSAGYVYVSDLLTTGHVWYAAKSLRSGTGTTWSGNSGDDPTGVFITPEPQGDLIWVYYGTGAVDCMGNALTTAATGATPRFVTADSDYIYWAGSGTGEIYYTPLATTSPTPLPAPTVLASGEATPWGITTDATESVYWANYGPPASIRHATLSGGSWNVTTVATGTNITDVVVDSTAIYWVDFGAGEIMQLNK